jgi:high-affinity K+ transport system ATPase subunit B
MLRAQDLVRVSAGQMIPGDGEVVEDVASIDESAIPVNRPRSFGRRAAIGPR